jgi:hypothetical protein
MKEINGVHEFNFINDKYLIECILNNRLIEMSNLS